MSFHLIPIRMIIMKNQNNTCWKECGGQRALIHCWLECKLVYSLLKTAWRLFSNLKIDTSYNSTIPVLGIYGNEMKSAYKSILCSPMFVPTQFMIVKLCNQASYPSTDIDKENVTYIHYRILTRHKKEWSPGFCFKKDANGNYMQSEISQTHKWSYFLWYVTFKAD